MPLYTMFFFCNQLNKVLATLVTSTVLNLTNVCRGEGQNYGIWGQKSPSDVQAQSPGKGSGDNVPQKLKHFNKCTALFRP